MATTSQSKTCAARNSNSCSIARRFLNNVRSTWHRQATLVTRLSNSEVSCARSRLESIICKSYEANLLHARSRHKPLWAAQTCTRHSKPSVASNSLVSKQASKTSIRRLSLLTTRLGRSSKTWRACLRASDSLSKRRTFF